MTTWIGASYVLGREVSTDEPYPHVCRRPFLARVNPALGRLRLRGGDWKPECAACAEIFQPKRKP